MSDDIDHEADAWEESLDRSQCIVCGCDTDGLTYCSSIYKRADDGETGKNQ